MARSSDWPPCRCACASSRRAWRRAPEAESLLGSAQEELAEARKELRDPAHGLHPATLTDHGLPAALSSLVARGGACESGGSGLQGLADRVGALGGRLVVASEPGEGTVVQARIPLNGG